MVMEARFELDRNRIYIPNNAMLQLLNQNMNLNCCAMHA
jgi:hypothetical protein